MTASKQVQTLGIWMTASKPMFSLSICKIFVHIKQNWKIIKFSELMVTEGERTVRVWVRHAHVPII